MRKTEWRTARHQPLTKLAEGLWQVEAELPSLPIGRRMVIIRLATGDLVVHSVVACDETTMAQVDHQGRVGYVVVPSGYHRMDAPAYAARYPNAAVLTPIDNRSRVGKVVRVDGALDALPTDRALRWESLAGVPKEAVLIHTGDQGAVTLVFNDSFMNLPERLPGLKGAVVKLIGSTGGPKVTRTARIALVQERRLLADHLRRLAAMPGLIRIIPGHGSVVEGAETSRAALERAAAGLG